jgi:predicted lipid-binding transport protein (Tim44 family)
MTRIVHGGKAIVLWGFIALVFCLWSMGSCAEARVGGGGSFGSRGSRSFSAPSRPSSPAPGSMFGGRDNSPSSSAARPYAPPPEAPYSRPAPYSQPSSFGGGGFWRGVAGGVVGGMVGNMLFRSLGFAGSTPYNGGGYGGGGYGGPGLFDLLLLAGLAYLAYRWISRRSTFTGDYYGAGSSPGGYRQDWPSAPPARQDNVISLPPVQERELDRGIEQLRVLDHSFDPQRFCDQSMDFFFRLQAAWSVRDMSPLHAQLADEVTAKLQTDVDRLKREHVINHVENIAVRTCEISEAWQESGQDFVTVYFYANCLDYDVNESTGEVVRGSKTEPGKFEEFWTFTRPAGNGAWKLSAINQA